MRNGSVTSSRAHADAAGESEPAWGPGTSSTIRGGRIGFHRALPQSPSSSAVRRTWIRHRCRDLLEPVDGAGQWWSCRSPTRPTSAKVSPGRTSMAKDTPATASISVGWPISRAKLPPTGKVTRDVLDLSGSAPSCHRLPRKPAGRTRVPLAEIAPHGRAVHDRQRSSATCAAGLAKMQPGAAAAQIGDLSGDRRQLCRTRSCRRAGSQAIRRAV